MVPSTLWLLRSRRRVLLAGAAATLAGALFILACMHWFRHQPYVVPQATPPSSFPPRPTLSQLLYFFLDVPFLLLPIVALFLPTPQEPPTRHRHSSPIFVGYLFLALYPSHFRGNFPLEPTLAEATGSASTESISLTSTGIRPSSSTTAPVFFTIVSFGGLLVF